MNKLVTEFIGTFFLVLTIALVEPGATAPFVIGAILMCMVYMGGPISGAHYNPAVTLAILLRGKISGPEAGRYMLAQLLGAFCGAALAYFLSHPPAPAGVEIRAALVVHPATQYTVFYTLGAEVLFTFALALVVLNVATVARTAGNSYYGVAIGFTVAVGAACVGSRSGGAFNPAVGLGANLFAAFFKADVLHSWLYIVGPCLGAVLAALVFKVQHREAGD